MLKQLEFWLKVIYPFHLLTPLKLQEILDLVKEALIKTNPEYDIVIKRLHLHYNMKLVTFGIDRKRNLIMQFPIFVQPYTQQPLILYQLETVPVLIVDKNYKANSYIELQIKETLYSIKFRNIYKHMTTRVSYM